MSAHAAHAKSTAPRHLARHEWRRGRMVEMIEDAARERRPCPSNATFARALGYQLSNSASWLLACLCRDRIVTIRGYGLTRVVTVLKSGLTTGEPAELQARAAIAEAALLWGIRAADIYGPSQRRCHAMPRNAVYAVLSASGIGYSSIGRILARDHSTVGSGVRRAQAVAERDELYRARLHELTRRFAPIAARLAE